MGSKQANTEIIKLNLLYTGLLMQDWTFRLGFMPNTIAHFLKKSRAIKKAWYYLVWTLSIVTSVLILSMQILKNRSWDFKEKPKIL